MNDTYPLSLNSYLLKTTREEQDELNGGNKISHKMHTDDESKYHDSLDQTLKT